MIPLDPVPRPIDRLPSMGDPAAVAIADRVGLLDYAGLEDAVGALASWLHRAGLRAGDRVASWLPKTRSDGDQKAPTMGKRPEVEAKRRPKASQNGKKSSLYLQSVLEGDKKGLPDSL